MKKIFRTLLCLSLVLTMCLGLVACGEFGGNYHEATTEEIATFASLDTDSVVTAGVDGWKMSVNAVTKVDDIEVNVSLSGKISVKDGVAASFNTKTSTKGSVPGILGGTQNIDTVISADAFFDKEYVYTHTVITDKLNEEKSSETKTKMPRFLSGVDDLVEEFFLQYGDIIDDMDIFDMTAEELQTEGIKVYFAESGDDVKVKIVFDDTSKGEEAVYGKGTVIYVFGANKAIKAMKVDLSFGDSKVSMEMVPFSGSVKLPSDLDSYKILELN